MNNVHFSSKSIEWGTPTDLYNRLNEEFHFTLDPCPKNPKFDGLKISWSNQVVYCNPPYGREIWKWIAKSFYSSKNDNSTVVMLLPARTDTKWFWDYCILGEIRFIKGRVRFVNKFGDETPAPFPSMIVVFRP